MATEAELQAALDKLQSDVTDLTTVEDSVITLLGGLKTALDNALAAGTPQQVVDQVTALSAAIEARKQALTDAATANTPTP